MNEDNERDWLAELAERHQAMMRDIEQIKQILRGNESLVPQIEQILPLMRDAVALRRQIKPIVQAAEQFARGAQWAKTGALALPLPLQLALAVNADLRDLLPAASRPFTT